MDPAGWKAFLKESIVMTKILILMTCLLSLSQVALGNGLMRCTGISETNTGEYFQSGSRFSLFMTGISKGDPQNELSYRSGASLLLWRDVKPSFSTLPDYEFEIPLTQLHQVHNREIKIRLFDVHGKTPKYTVIGSLVGKNTNGKLQGYLRTPVVTGPINCIVR